MSILEFQVLFIACLVSFAAALPGVFLVLRGVALMSDAISHAILPGIILMFLLVHNLNSPFLIVGSSLAGLLTVICTEIIIQTRCLKKDAAIGLVYPLFFSVGVILISQCARNVHLDTDMVLLGELAFAPFNRFFLFGLDMGPMAMWSMGAITIINSIFVFLFYKELQLSTFDNTFAYVLGFSPTFLYYGLMTITSITAVGAFDVVGSIVVVALMITPAATAYLLTDHLPHMIMLSIGNGVLSAVSGYVVANFFDISIAGSIAVMCGLFFIATLFCAPYKGIVARMVMIKKRDAQLAENIICTYLLEHGSQSNNQLAYRLNWQIDFVDEVIHNLVIQTLVKYEKQKVHLTAHGKRYSKLITSEWNVTEHSM